MDSSTEPEKEKKENDNFPAKFWNDFDNILAIYGDHLPK
jgi:hypothetical protein